MRARIHMYVCVATGHDQYLYPVGVGLAATATQGAPDPDELVLPPAQDSFLPNITHRGWMF